MSPVPVSKQASDDVMPTLKDTFIDFSCPNDDEDFIESGWSMRRQVSEPATMWRKQVSARDNVGRLTQRLSSCDEDDSEEHSDENDKEFAQKEWPAKSLDEIDSFNTDVAKAFNRQISSLSMQGFDRQASTLSTQGFDRQGSCLSAPGFCRQVTEQQWPSYPLQAHDDSTNIDKTETPQQDVESYAKEASNEESTNMGNCPMLMPMYPLQMAYAMNSGMLPQIMLNGMAAEGYDVGAGAPSQSSASATRPQMKNRRKATSLITLAQEAQRQKQLEWSQQLEQQLKGWLPKVQPNSQSGDSSSATEEVQVKETVPAARAEKEDGVERKEACKFCPHCGSGVKKHFKFCQFCGKSIAAIWDL